MMILFGKTITMTVINMETKSFEMVNPYDTLNTKEFDEFLDFIEHKWKEENGEL